MYCTVCGYGGELKTLNDVMICPRCHASGDALVDIPAMAQGPIYKLDVDDPDYGSLYTIDVTRDSDSGFTNPNLHRRAELSSTGSSVTIQYPPNETVSATTFKVDTVENTLTITGYTGTANYMKIPDIFPQAGYRTIGKNAFTDTDVVYVEIPEGITTIE